MCSLETDVVSFNLSDLKIDIDRGMYFDSSIPQGYGVGSSGALVASIYDKYANDKITVLENLTREKLLKLKVPLFISEIMIFEIKYPDITKNKSTPSHPPLNSSKSAW